MPSSPKFCTCKDLNCDLHPQNQNNECTACIEKNLRHHEIPVCFWNRIGKGLDEGGDYSFYKFAEKVMAYE